MKTRDAFLARIEAFLTSTGMSAARFGIEAVGDHKFVKRLSSGAGITLTVIERAETFMAERSGNAAATAVQAAE